MKWYAELGIREFVFYWPPIDDLIERRDVKPARRDVVEEISRARFQRGFD